MSKIDVFSATAGTYCEQYFYLAEYWPDPSLNDVPESSRFGDVVFIDIVKPQLFSSQSKVRQEGKSPFIGHAGALHTQLAWNPNSWVRASAPVILWSLCFRDARHLTSASAEFPRLLGGLELGL